MLSWWWILGGVNDVSLKDGSKRPYGCEKQSGQRKAAEALGYRGP